MDAQAERLVWTMRETAQMLHVSERTLWSWVQRRVVPHVRVGKTIRFPRAALETWLAEQSRQAAEPAGERTP